MRTALCLVAAAFLTAAPAHAGEVIEVKITELTFAPLNVTAHVGDTVEWTNSDFVAHTATATKGAFDVMIPAGATRPREVRLPRLREDQPGTRALPCDAERLRRPQSLGHDPVREVWPASAAEPPSRALCA